jgi:4-hydroxyphenylpyruvate dioxygenase
MANADSGGGTSYEFDASTAERPSYGSFLGFDHVHFVCGNAKCGGSVERRIRLSSPLTRLLPRPTRRRRPCRRRLTADWYVARFGFRRVAYRGLETGSRALVSHVVRQGAVTFVLTSALNPGGAELLGSDIGAHLVKHGDGVKDIAFSVTDARAVYEYAVSRGARSVAAPAELADADGAVVTATVQTYGDTTHTFVQRGGFAGAFLPGFRAVAAEDPLERVTPPVGLDFIDHIVGNVPDREMEPTVQWYEKMLSFHRFWSVDDSQMHTAFSALRSVVVADFDEVVKMPINEPAAGQRKSQIQEYCDYYAGAGVQHIAINTRDIIGAIARLRARGVAFLRVPDAYYDALEARLARAPFAVKQDLAELKRLNILLDMDDKGYLLQLFTSCVQDRPTVFLEIIQREGCSGFGAGNFKSLFEAIEREQAERGNLT